MEELLIDCSPGVSGDMLLGAFYDLGVPEKIIEKPLIDLGLANLYSLKFQESKSCSIRGVKVQVKNISPNTIALSDSTNQFHGVDMEQLSFRDYMRNNTDLETLQPTNDDEVVAAKIEVVVEDLVEETRQVVFDKHGQAKLPF